MFNAPLRYLKGSKQMTRLTEFTQVHIGMKGFTVAIYSTK